uniref:SLAM family member 7 n=2 Tax=Canis lupus familiaris TaxID=9615 RepID=A0A8C0SQA4_CANLF
MLVPPAHFTIFFLLFQLTEHLSKPKVTMGLQNKENGTCVTNLTCFVDQGGEDVTYSWESLGQAANKSYNGSILPISWRLGKGGMTFICVARNPISSNSSNPVFAWKLCEELYSRRKFCKYTLFLCANTPKDGETPLSPHITRHTKVICL